MAGVDFPREEERLAELVSAREAGRRSTTVLNDTFAVLRAGTERGLGGRSRLRRGDQLRRRRARRPAGPLPRARRDHRRLGRRLRRRARRGLEGGAQLRRPRPRRRRSSSAVPAHFGFETPYELAEAIHAQERSPSAGCSSCRRSCSPRPRHDEVAAEIVDRLADEVVALAWTALTRLGLDRRRGRGSARRRSPAGSRIRGWSSGSATGCRGVATVRVTGSPPIVGAALLALDELGAGGEAQARVRAELCGGGRWLRCTSGRRRASTRGTMSRGRRARPRHRRRRVHGARRTVRLGEDDRAADAGRARGGRRRRDLHRRARRDVRARRRTATWRWSSRTMRSTRT